VAAAAEKRMMLLCGCLMGDIDEMRKNVLRRAEEGEREVVEEESAGGEDEDECEVEKQRGRRALL
jgi:hypothetical protein